MDLQWIFNGSSMGLQMGLKNGSRWRWSRLYESVVSIKRQMREFHIVLRRLGRDGSSRFASDLATGQCKEDSIASIVGMTDCASSKDGSRDVEDPKSSEHVRNKQHGLWQAGWRYSVKQKQGTHTTSE